MFSRDELKQDDMRHQYQHLAPETSDKIKFYVGDVRDSQSVADAMHGVDYVFHAAALKQVPSCPGDVDMITFMWASEAFDLEKPYTHHLTVQE